MRRVATEGDLARVEGMLRYGDPEVRDSSILGAGMRGMDGIGIGIGVGRGGDQYQQGGDHTQKLRHRAPSFENGG